jgi:P27 family predicted phage terminase small subunit
MRGRKPLPSHLKLITGNPGKRPLRDDDIKPAIAFPMPPPFLCDDAKVEWGRIGGELYALQILSNIDTAALGAYCQSFAMWKQANEALNQMAQHDQLTRGLMIKTSNGNAIQNPMVGTINKAAADMVRYAAEFGMTPSARARLTGGMQQKRSKFDGLIGARKA